MVLIYVLVALLAVVVVGGLIMWTRGAASSTRQLGLPTAAEPAAMYRGDVMSRHLITSGMFARLEFFDWGVRLRGIAICRWLVPTWEARYDELARVDLVASRSRIAVWLRLRGEPGGIGFLTNYSREILDSLEKRGVSVNRSEAQFRRVDEMYRDA
jgi:hypothetical protein